MQILKLVMSGYELDQKKRETTQFQLISLMKFRFCLGRIECENIANAENECAVYRHMHARTFTIRNLLFSRTKTLNGCTLPNKYVIIHDSRKINMQIKGRFNDCLFCSNVFLFNFCCCFSSIVTPIQSSVWRPD